MGLLNQGNRIESDQSFSLCHPRYNLSFAVDLFGRSLT